MAHEISFKLYNALAKQVVDFHPAGKVVGIYSCGPTAYESMQIGNVASFIYADTLRRALKVSGYKVKHAMNITDVDDKTVRNSQQKYPDLDPKDALKKLTSEFKSQILADMDKAYIATEEMTIVDATDYIDEMQQLIKNLVDKNFAYLADDGIYFSIKEYEAAGHSYGQLSHISRSGDSKSRINNDEYAKESAQDFALWKKAKPNEPKWDFEINGQDFSGRPGWHIECSAMSTKLLGQPFDIHTGGIDLIFPHHENEIAQSTALHHDLPLAHWFTHNGHILVDGKKMSKSLNNYYTLTDILDKNFSAADFRYLVLQSHYRSSPNFTWDSIEAAKNTLAKIYQAADRIHQLVASDTKIDFDGSTRVIIKHLGNDLDIPQVLVELHKTIDHIISGGVGNNQSDEFNSWLELINGSLGLPIFNREDISPSQKIMLKDRLAARNRKDWEKSDIIRDQLKEEGIIVMDNPSQELPQTWTRVN